MAELRDAERTCREALLDGATPEEAVGRLHASGSTIIDAIRAIRGVFSLSLGQAKRLVTEHPAWHAEVVANQPIQDAAEAAAKERDTKEPPE